MSRKIIIIAEDKDVVDHCSLILSDLEYDIFSASSCEQAVNFAKQNIFDLVIVSEIVQTSSGIEVFELIRQSAPTVSGVLIIDSTDFAIVTEAVNSGIGRVCKKTMLSEELLDYVHVLLNTVTLRDDIARMKTLFPLYNLIERFIIADDEQAIYSELVNTVFAEIDVSSVSVMIFDNKTELLKIVACKGLDTKIVQGVQTEPGEKIAGKVFLSRRPVIFNRQSQHLSPFINLLKRDSLAAAISFPMIRRGVALGVLNVSQTRDGMEFSEADIEMLSIISGQAMLAIENIRSIREHEENSRIKALFGQYVSPDITGILMQQGQNPMELGSVQVLTVLFADIRNFTLLVQHLKLDFLRSFLTSFFDLFSNIIFSHQGMLDKFMGDAALVIFGAPVEIEVPDIEAVNSAKQIICEFEELRLELEKKAKVFKKIGLGVGISRGEMFLGNVGSSRRLDYTVIGTDVNIAQRLAAETKSGQILITDRVYANLQDTSSIVARPSRVLRGMEVETEVYSIDEFVV